MLLLYTAAAPTHDLRARLPLLMGGIRLKSLLVFLSVLAMPGLLALLVTRKATRASVGGLFVGAVACLLMIGTGVPSALLPDFESTRSRILASAAAVGVCAILVWRDLRRRNSDRSIVG
jgi:hypothetical protein